MWACLPFTWAQSSGGPLTVEPPAKVSVRRGASVEAAVQARLSKGFHTNSHTPSESYLIPLRLTWTGPLKVAAIDYPQPVMEKYAFSDKPLSVFTGDFSVKTRFEAPATAMSGPAMMSGKLRYQACNHDSCLPPKTVEIKLPVVIQ